jgi:endonuclease/exonuclease/phosphatase family metal-dependent hydrolase
MSATLKVFTFNLRTATTVDGINYFFNRTGRVFDTIKEHSPDLIGFQEATGDMRKWLGDALAPIGYNVVGCGRGKDYRGEATCIAYKRDIFELISLDTRWLSATPLVPGSRYAADQSSCPRVYTAATLKHNDSEEKFIFLNTHLDHKGSEARKLGALDVIRYLSERGLPCIITGDMNAVPGTPEINVFTAYELNGKNVIDATANIGGTFHAFGKIAPENMKQIDYIFTTLPCDTTKSFVLPDEPIEGLYISDHRPVCAFVELA